MHRPVRALSVAVIALLVGGAAVARSACNTIPSADRSAMVMPPLPEDPAARFGYKGALGRIDRVHLLPVAGTEPTAPGAPAMTIVADGVCIGPSGRATLAAAPTFGKVDDLVALVYFRSADGKRIVIRGYGSPDACDELQQRAKATHEADVRIEMLPACSLAGVKTIPITPSTTGLRIPLPQPSELAGALAAGPLSPAVRVLLATKDRAPVLLAPAAKQRCVDMCGDPKLAACLDDVFAVTLSSTGQPTYDPDEVPCTVQLPTNLKANDFGKLCENEDATTPSCQPGGPDELDMWQDSCGGVHVPFDWTGIRPATQQTRWVRGRTGLGRKKPDENPAIWVPGREFVGSTPIADPQGTTPGVSWRKPFVDVSYQAPLPPQEFGLKGTVDQDDSIIHVFPRLRTKLVCAGTTNACMGVDQDPTGGIVTCACADRGLPGCTCDVLKTAIHFACSGATNRGMPCTRDRHCNPDGRCDARPRCQRVGDVWTGPSDDTGKACDVDEDCANEGDEKQCGYRLFNLQDAIDHPANTPAPDTGIVALDGKIVGNAAHKRRGACKANGAACGNGNGPGACPQGDCRGYQLTAGPLQ